MNLAKLRKEMEQTLERKRYEHTLGVAYTAANLAMVHGVDVEKALIAGMLHDCAKCMSHHKQISLCRKNKMMLSEIETENRSPLLHAKAGSCLARKKYGITDEEILQAISYHTTGRPHMSPLEKVIYIADYIEPGRERAKRSYADVQSLQEVRKTAYQDLDRTLCRILSDTLDYLSRKGGKIDSMTRDTYEYYCQIHQ
ncbi:MAG: bis(5'-nucleosyl)-tetraphosphatase (symmetrical) YqeK [Lachnospiraceae bacterium]|nr:bis(5'-nucleosyl)-tetraphosphatase (symmetrical) YqeK [Lachnospiraceae bacterium]